MLVNFAGGGMNHQEFMYILRLVNFSLITFTGLHHLNFKSAIQNSCKNKRCMVFEWRKPGIHRVNKCQDHFMFCIAKIWRSWFFVPTVTWMVKPLVTVTFY